MSHVKKQTADYQLADLSPVLKAADAGNILLESLPVWLSAQTRKSAGRGRSVNNTRQYGVQKLRELILELAVRGQLVPQDPNDTPAIGLIESIERDLNVLTKISKSKKNMSLPEISPEEYPYGLPQGWVFIRNGNLFKLRKGKKPKNLTENLIGAPYLDIEALDRGNITRYTNDESCPKATSEDILVVCDGSRSGLVLNGMNGVIGSTLAVIQTPKWLQQFIKLIFSHGFSRWNTSMKGAAIPHLDTKNLVIEATALPPINEQHRIVKKVDELMALCDQLEKQQADAVQAHDTLVKVLLDTLTQSENAEDFQQNWRRIAEHFDTLFSTESSIDQLKQTLLQLAVMGKLVPQDPNDEPASVLLKKIAAEKAQLFKDKKIKKQRILSTVIDSEFLYPAPFNWEWIRFAQVVNFRSELVKATDFQDMDQVAPDSIEKGTGKLIYRRTVQESGAIGPNNRFYKGQILYSKIRPSLSKAIIAEFDGLCSADMYPLDALISSEYLLKTILSEPFLAQVRVAENRIKMPKLNIESLSNFVIALPPLQEQHRIVKKVDELMALCDQLKDRLNQTQTLQQQLADAVVQNSI